MNHEQLYRRSLRKTVLSIDDERWLRDESLRKYVYTAGSSILEVYDGIPDEQFTFIDLAADKIVCAECTNLICMKI